MGFVFTGRIGKLIRRAQALTHAVGFLYLKILMKNKITYILGAVIVVLICVTIYQQYKISYSKADSGFSVNQGVVNAFDLQQKCQQEADKFFPNAVDTRAVSATYTNHYDPNTNKCLINVRDSIKNSAVPSGYNYYQTVWDVNEAAIYAMYVSDLAGWDSSSSGTLLCFVGSINCKTGSEFDTLIAQKFGFSATQ